MGSFPNEILLQNSWRPFWYQIATHNHLPSGFQITFVSHDSTLRSTLNKVLIRSILILDFHKLMIIPSLFHLELSNWSNFAPCSTSADPPPPALRSKIEQKMHAPKVPIINHCDGWSDGWRNWSLGRMFGSDSLSSAQHCIHHQI